ncbi:MAG: hypothetical protein ACRDP7_44420 [Trebonia sp.]
MYGAPPIVIGQLSVPDKNREGAALVGVPAPDEAGAGSAAGAACPVDTDGDAGAAGREGVAPARCAAPVDAAPVDTAPVDAAPVDTAPVDTAPVDTAQVDTAPVDTAPVDAAPVDANCAVLPQAASAASKTAMPAGARSLVYRYVREPRQRCGFNRRRQPS